MVSIARKNLFSEKTRLVISVGGVAFSVMLLIILISLFQGWRNLMTLYISNVKADIWLVQEGAEDMFHSISILSQEKESDLEKVDGVEAVYRLLGRQMSFELNGEEVLSFIFGYDIDSGVGGPTRVIEGKESPSSGEIIVDKVFIDNKGLIIGDLLRISGKDFTIAGISEGGNMAMYQYSFINQSDAEEIFEMQGLTNYYLISTNSGFEKETVRDNLNQVISGTDALLSSEFAYQNQKVLDEVFIPIIGVLVLVGFLVGISVISLTIYTATIEKSQEYGILKAIGFSNSSLYKIIFEQSLISAIIGFVVGIIAAYFTNLTAEKFVPEFTTIIKVQDVILVFVTVIIMSLIASYLPVRRIAKIDPVDVFKS